MPNEIPTHNVGVYRDLFVLLDQRLRLQAHPVMPRALSSYDRPHSTSALPPVNSSLIAGEQCFVEWPVPGITSSSNDGLAVYKASLSLDVLAAAMLQYPSLLLAAWLVFAGLGKLIIHALDVQT